MTVQKCTSAMIKDPFLISLQPFPSKPFSPLDMQLKLLLTKSGLSDKEEYFPALSF